MESSPGIRVLKRRMGDLLRGDDLPAALDARAVNPLISFFCSPDEVVRWHAITAMGHVVSQMAVESVEAARVVMRRLMWSLNDESGGIGWGAPEAMGEIMARCAPLAHEYAHILNYLEYVALQRGVAWGLGRLAHERSALLPSAVVPLTTYLASPDDQLRGLAAWAACALVDPQNHPPITKLLADQAMITIYMNQRLSKMRIGDLIRSCVAGMDGSAAR
jgi:hypothetical protein